MPFDRSTAPNYVKGTMDVWCHNTQTGDLDLYTKYVQTSQFQTTVNMSPINAMMGNPVVINLPDSAAVKLTLTAADFSLEARALSVGTTVSYNGIVPVIESVPATGSSLVVSKTPVAPYGVNKIFCFIDNGGTAYTIDAATKTVQGFSATPGTTYCVRYFITSASAKYLAINAAFSPSIETVMLRIPAYSAQGGSSTQGSRVGSYYVWIPRMQFEASNVDSEFSQTTAAVTNYSGTALSYNEAVAAGVCTELPIGKLAYMVYMPESGATTNVTGLAVVGGEIAVDVGDTVQCPVKYVMDNGELVQPDYADLTYVITDTNTATVSTAGVITGVAAGDTEITVTVTDRSPAITTVANVEVSA